MRRMMIGCLGGLPQPITDSFNRADSSNSLGNTDTGQTWVNSAVYGNPLGISGNKAYNSANVDAAAVVETNFQSGSLSMVMSTTTSYQAFIFRYIDNNNYCQAVFYGNSYYIQGKVSGASFSAGSVYGPVPVNGDTLKITMSGTTISFYRNGVFANSITVTQNQTGTKHGIYAYGTGARIDSFQWDAI